MSSLHGTGTMLAALMWMLFVVLNFYSITVFLYLSWLFGVDLKIVQFEGLGLTWIVGFRKTSAGFWGWGRAGGSETAITRCYSGGNLWFYIVYGNISAGHY